MVILRLDVRRFVIGLLAMIMALVIAVLPQERRTPDTIPTQPATRVAPTPAAALTLVAPERAPTSLPIDLAPYPIFGPAAEIRNDVWLNVDEPVRLADLRGHVVLLEFWAFECPPCQQVLPNVRGWYETYRGQGLTVIGIHYPKVEAERDYDKLVDALARLDVPYPVAQDNDGLTWHAYGQTVEPTIDLIDKRGYLRYRQVGAGGYDETEAAIRALLEEAG